MILLTTLWLGALTITGFSTRTGTYDREISVNDYQKCQSIVFGYTGTGYAHYLVETSVNNNFQMAYDSSDDESYYLYNFRINVTSTAYFVLQDGTYEIDQVLTYQYRPDWEITPSSYSQEYERLNFNVVIYEDEFHIDCYYDNELIDQVTDDIDNYASPSQNRLEISFNSEHLFDEIEDLLQFAKVSYDSGYSQGALDGALDGVQMNPEMFTIFNGILNIAMIPINVFLAIFNFEVFGINIASAVTAVLSICILVIVIRMITGGKADGD